MADTVAHTNGELIEVRCTLRGCPAPLIAAYLPEFYGPGAADSASEQHLWVHHILPKRMRHIEEAANAQPSSLEAIMPGIGAIMAEHGLRFGWETSR